MRQRRLVDRACSGAGLKVSGITVGQYDMLGKATIEDGIEYAVFTCNGCGYVRLHDPAFVR